MLEPIRFFHARPFPLGNHGGYFRLAVHQLTSKGVVEKQP